MDAADERSVRRNMRLISSECLRDGWGVSGERIRHGGTHTCGSRTDQCRGAQRMQECAHAHEGMRARDDTQECSHTA